MNIEIQRLKEDRERKKHWKKWGPYLTERQWGTVREDYSKDGSAWENVTHEDARSKAYRWGEEGIAGICDHKQKTCISWAFWNGKDHMIKERLFGLTGNQGNHGEDVKELYYYLDSTPSHSYMKMLYKYPQNEFPYEHLVYENRKRGKSDREFELIDTGLFDEDAYFDIFIEYAKQDAEDIMGKATIFNRGKEDAEIWVMPTIWFRKTWFTGHEPFMPKLSKIDDNRIKAFTPKNGNYFFTFDGNPELKFCDNETNRQRLYHIPNEKKYLKDGINDYVVDGDDSHLNPENYGTKAAAIYKLNIPAGESVDVKFRMMHQSSEGALEVCEEILEARKKDAEEFYGDIQKTIEDEDLKRIQRQAFAGMMWGKQFYYYNVERWLDGDSGRYVPPVERKKGRNHHWRHLQNYDIISMPDKWEYPWYAAWDLAFHCIPLARVDPDFAKDQLILLLNEWYMHPNGQIPAYEWNFSDVNPPVHAYAVERVYQIDKKMNGGVGDEDIYLVSFNRKVKEAGPRLTLLKGKVYDEKSGQVLEAALEIINNTTGEVVKNIATNSATGRYMVSLPGGINYGISVTAKGYLFNSVNVNMPDSAGYVEVEKDIPLKRIEVGSTIVLNNIFYDFDKASLRKESISELDRLTELLKENPSMRIELSSHTDSKGTDEYNVKLSQMRAQAVVDYLKYRSINADRLVAMGYGELKPVATNETDEGRQLNRRTEFKILSK